MSIFNEFPYTNYHELNLDWIIKKTQDLIAEWLSYKENMELWKNETETAFNNLKNYVEDYFRNLDINTEINEKIDDLLNTGALNPYIANAAAAWLGSQLTPTTPPLDKSLSIADAAADAETTGNSLMLTRGDNINILKTVRPADGKTAIHFMLDGIAAVKCTNNGSTRMYLNTVTNGGDVVEAVGINPGYTGALNITDTTAYIILYADTYPINVNISPIYESVDVPAMAEALQYDGLIYEATYTEESPREITLYPPNLLKGSRILVTFENPARESVDIGVALKKIGDDTRYHINRMYFKDRMALIELDDNYDYIYLYRNSDPDNFKMLFKVMAPLNTSNIITHSAFLNSKNIIRPVDVQFSNNTTVNGSVDLDSGFIKVQGINAANTTLLINDSIRCAPGEYVARFIFKKPVPLTDTFGIAQGTTSGYIDMRGDGVSTEYVGHVTLTEETMLNAYMWFPNGETVGLEFSLWFGKKEDYNRFYSYGGANINGDYQKDFYADKLFEVFNNKKVNFLGDSITFGAGADYPFSKVIEKYTENSIIRNYGISGSTLQYRADREPMCVRYADMDNNADIVAVMGGTNDYWLNLPLGQMGDTTYNTFYGALDVLINGIINKYPRAFFYMVTPAHGYIAGDYTEETKSQSGSMADMVNAIKTVAAKYSVPVLDLFDTANMYPRIQAQKNIYYTDGVHMKNAGQNKLAYLHAAFVRSHYNHG